jgi:hypothetical protein
MNETETEDGGEKFFNAFCLVCGTERPVDQFGAHLRCLACRTELAPDDVRPPDAGDASDLAAGAAT